MHVSTDSINSTERSNQYWLTFGIFLYAILLRCLSYFSNRSLWIDEAMLSLNIIHRNLSALIFTPMDYNQVAPIGFLVISKAIILLLGNGEFALRLFPFLCSIIALFLFYKLSKNILSKRGSLIALSLFTISRGLVYYSGEVKQYSSDALITIIILSLSWHTFSKGLSFQAFLLLGIVGAVSIWLAYPAIFVLAGIGITLLIYIISGKDWKAIIGLLTATTFWTCSMVIYFIFFLEPLRKSSAHKEIWKQVWDQQLSTFMPSILSFEGWQWLGVKLLEIFKFPMGLDVHILALGLFFIGITYFIKSKEKSKLFILGLSISPLIVTLTMSAFHIYPFMGRLLLFLTPCLLIPLAQGIDKSWEKLNQKIKLSKGSLGWLIIALLLVPPMLSRRLYVHKNEEIKPILKQLEIVIKPGDVVYADYGAQPAVRYYQNQYHTPKIFGLNYKSYIQGMSSRQNGFDQYIQQELKPLTSNSRLWLVFSHIYNQEDKRYLHYLQSQNLQITQTLKDKNTSAYLLEKVY